MISRRTFLQGIGAATAGAVGLSGSAIAEPFATLVTRYQISPPRWPHALRVKLAVIADLHACEPWMGLERIRHIVRHTNALEPDCILLLGDYVAGGGMLRYGHHVAEKDWARELGRLKAPLGVHAVLGNHDFWADRDVQRRGCGMPAAGLALLDAGVPVYENACLRLQKEGGAFWLGGLGDQNAFPNGPACRRDPTMSSVGADDLAGTLRQVTDDAPIVLMAHEPDIFPDVPDRVSLTVAGHTHGGQVRLLGYAPVIPSRFGNRYRYGHKIEESRNLVVSAGLGCSGLPLRLGAPPEIVLIELSA